MKKAEDFEAQVREKEISRWKIHTCGMCGYPCGFIFRDSVYYDSGCDCVTYSDLRLSSFDEVAEMYNSMQTHEDTIKRYDEFWGFEQM